MRKKRRSIPTYSHLSGESVVALPIGKVAVLLGTGLSLLSLFFSDSPFFFLFFFFINSKSPSDASAKIMIFELKKKKEEGSREWGLWFFRARTQDLKLDFHLEIEFLRHDLLKKSSLTNSRY